MFDLKNLIIFSQINGKNVFLKEIFILNNVNVYNMFLKPPRKSIKAQNGIVATSQQLATKIGLEILKKGGNCVDAAISTAISMGAQHIWQSSI